MQTTFALRRFFPPDLELVMQINQTCLPENYAPSFFLNLHKRFPETFLVAEERDKVIGYIMCRIESGMPNLRRFPIIKKGHIISIAVLPRYQRKGVGHALVHKAMLNMAAYDVQECYLEVRTSNTAAVNLYRKIGFEMARLIKEYYADGETAYLMAINLSADTGS